jgi:hypothetical protein
MAIQLKNFENELNKLDELVKEGIGLFDDKQCTRVSGDKISKLEEIEFILLDNLEEKTNLQNEFFQLKASYYGAKSFGNLVHTILAQLGNSSLERNFKNLIEILNKYVTQIRAKPIQSYTFYIPTRIEIQLNDAEYSKLKKISKRSLNLTLINKLPQKLSKQIKKSGLNSLFQNREVNIKLTYKARDVQFALDNHVNKNVDAFVGLIAYANHYRRTLRRWRTTIISDDSISELPLESPNLFLILTDKKISYPEINNPYTMQNLDIQIQQHKIITTIGKTFWNIHNNFNGNYKFILSLLNILKGQNDCLRDFSKELLKLYLNSITEKQVEISFLKFWVISEKILKSAGSINDDKILQILKKLMRKSSERRIKILYQKRNDMVHEFKIDRITQEDRNLSKVLSDSLMMIYFDPKAKFYTFEDFRFMLENLFLDKVKTKCRIKILKKLSS